MKPLNHCACPKPPGGVTEVVFRGKSPHCCACGGIIVPYTPSPTTLTPEKRDHLHAIVFQTLNHLSFIDHNRRHQTTREIINAILPHVAAWRE